MFLRHAELRGFLLRFSFAVVICLGLNACKRPVKPPKAETHKVIDIDVEAEVRKPAVTST